MFDLEWDQPQKNNNHPIEKGRRGNAEIDGRELEWFSKPQSCNKQGQQQTLIGPIRNKVLKQTTMMRDCIDLCQNVPKIHLAWEYIRQRIKIINCFWHILYNYHERDETFFLFLLTIKGTKIGNNKLNEMSNNSIITKRCKFVKCSKKKTVERTLYLDDFCWYFSLVLLSLFALLLPLLLFLLLGCCFGNSTLHALFLRITKTWQWHWKWVTVGRKKNKKTVWLFFTVAIVGYSMQKYMSPKTSVFNITLHRPLSRSRRNWE